VNIWSKLEESSIRIWRWVFLAIGLISLSGFVGRIIGVLHGGATGQGVTLYWLLNTVLELIAGLGGPWLWWKTRVRNGVTDEPTEI
jgi:hypothetical protein